MGNKNKIISFRVNGDAFETLQEIVEERDISLSVVFRDYVDMLVAHDGQAQIVPKHELEKLRGGEDGSFPPTVEVPKSFACEHEHLELEAEHLREQLEKHEGYMNYLHKQVRNDHDDVEKVIQLEDLDTGDEPSFRLG